jgi:hypothetical protein
MKLIYLSSANLKDRLFVKDFIHNFKWTEPTLVLHDAFGGTVKDTHFVTKRLSALLSECLVHNHAFPAAQRDFFYRKDGKLMAAKDKIESLFAHIHLVILGPVVKENGEELLADAQEMVQTAKEVFGVEELTLFTDNPLSPLGNKKIVVDSFDVLQTHLGIYEEEKAALQRAFDLRPACICSPVNYSM